LIALLWWYATVKNMKMCTPEGKPSQPSHCKHQQVLTCSGPQFT
jgi:hypothetical protein